MVNRKGQQGILGFFVILGVFVVLWALFIGSWVAQIGADAIVTNNMTGFEAFIWGNLNLWILLGVLGAGAGGVFLAGGSQ